MYTVMNKGTRVRYTDGREGTVVSVSDAYWATASVEFDNDKGCMIQKLKTDLTVIGEPEQQSALARMVEKLDRRNKRTSSGYVTQRDELIAILGEVSRLVSVSIVEKELPYSQASKDIAVEIRLSLTLERDKL